MGKRFLCYDPDDKSVQTKEGNVMVSNNYIFTFQPVGENSEDGVDVNLLSGSVEEIIRSVFSGFVVTGFVEVSTDTIHSILKFNLTDASLFDGDVVICFESQLEIDDNVFTRYILTIQKTGENVSCRLRSYTQKVSVKLIFYIKPNETPSWNNDTHGVTFVNCEDVKSLYDECRRYGQEIIYAGQLAINSGAGSTYCSRRYILHLSKQELGYTDDKGIVFQSDVWITSDDSAYYLESITFRMTEDADTCEVTFNHIPITKQ